MLNVLEHNTSTNGSSLAPNSTASSIQDATTYKGINNIAPKYIMGLIEISELRRDNMWSINAGIMLNVPPVQHKPLLQDQSTMQPAHYDMHSQRTSENTKH